MKMPAEWTIKHINSKIQASDKKKSITARIDMSEEVAGQGLCPECKEPMKRVIVNGIEALCCMNDRIVLPIKHSKE